LSQVYTQRNVLPIVVKNFTLKIDKLDNQSSVPGIYTTQCATNWAKLIGHIHDILSWLFQIKFFNNYFILLITFTKKNYLLLNYFNEYVHRNWENLDTLDRWFSYLKINMLDMHEQSKIYYFFNKIKYNFLSHTMQNILINYFLS
jgi:hypothetical protein